MKKLITLTLCSSLAFAMMSTASATYFDDYTFKIDTGYNFAKSSSLDYDLEISDGNVDTSKNSAVVPITFGSQNVILENFYTSSYGNPSYNTDTSYLANSSSNTNTSNTTTNTTTSTENFMNFFTVQKVDASDYYSDGSIGTLSIPKISLNVKVYEGTDDDTLSKGVGHFESTTIWSGNICLASHNRGVTDHFGQIHTLNYGDSISLTTMNGTLNYNVYSIEKISSEDSSVLATSTDNIITLITCVAGESNYRWCVKAKA